MITPVIKSVPRFSSPLAGEKVLPHDTAIDQKDKLVTRWRQNKALFMKQVLGYPLEPFQTAMLLHKGAVKVGRHIAMRLLPRDSGKSWAGTIGDCIFEVCMNPNLKSQIVAEALETATMFLSEIKAHFEGNDTLIHFFGNHKSNIRPWATKKIVSSQRTIIAKEPTVEAIGAGGATVGRHVDIQWYDDLVSERTSSTRDKQEKLEIWYDKVSFPVLTQGGYQRINGTRWYPTDLYHYLLEKHGLDILFRIPALTEIPLEKYNDPQNGDVIPFRYVNKQIEFSNSILRTYFSRRYDALILALMRKGNPASFASQYQNDISLLASKFINSEAIQLISSAQWPSFDELTFYIGVDPAVKEKKTSNYFATATIGFSERLGKIFIFRTTKQRITDAQAMLELIVNEWLWVVKQGGDVAEIGIESNAFQSVIAQTAYADPQRYGLLPITEIYNLKDKAQRLVAVAHYFNLGKIYIDEECQSFIVELMQFPDGEDDDQLDAVMNALQSLTTSSFDGLSLPLSIYDMALGNAAIIRF